MIRPIRTASEAWIGRHRDTHARHPAFGTHLHPYLRETVRDLAQQVTEGEKPTLLDYGCGKGAFLREMTRAGWFRFARGYDPAVAAFAARPAQLYDMVLCLDVLDQVEHPFVESVISDVAQFTGRIALFDVITVQTPALAHLAPRSAATWQELISGRMRVLRTTIRAADEAEQQQGACPERTIIVAAPKVRTGPDAA